MFSLEHVGRTAVPYKWKFVQIQISATAIASAGPEVALSLQFNKSITVSFSQLLGEYDMLRKDYDGAKVIQSHIYVHLSSLFDLNIVPPKTPADVV